MTIRISQPFRYLKKADKYLEYKNWENSTTLFNIKSLKIKEHIKWT